MRFYVAVSTIDAAHSVHTRHSYIIALQTMRMLVLLLATVHTSVPHQVLLPRAAVLTHRARKRLLAAVHTLMLH